MPTRQGPRVRVAESDLVSSMTAVGTAAWTTTGRETAGIANDPGGDADQRRLGPKTKSMKSSKARRADRRTTRRKRESEGRKRSGIAKGGREGTKRRPNIGPRAADWGADVWPQRRTGSTDRSDAA